MRLCAICGGEGRVIHRQPLVMPSTCLYRGYDVLACDRCGFVFADQGPTDDYYRHENKFMEATTERALHVAWTSRHLRERVHPNWSVVDFGCGDGQIARSLKGAVASVIGIDPYPGEGIVAEVPEGAHYDLVICSHVLEHVIDVNGFLHMLYALGDTFYIEVPDVATACLAHVDPRGANPRIFNRDLYTHFTPEHVNFFSATSLRNLMTRNGFVENVIESTPLGAIASWWRRQSPDTETARALEEYASITRGMQERALRTIADVAKSGREVLVWGAGLHTQRLLGNGGLDKVNIRAFVDSDPAYRGATLAGKPILAPGEMPDLPVLVSSFKAQSAIAKAAAGHETILLYE